jgi:transcriptional regulator with XRE-family HTH domain
MGSSPVVTSKSVGKLLRRRREALGLSLRQVAQRSGGRGEGIPASTLVRIEQGKLDPGVRRLNVLLRLYELDPEHVADLVELESLAVESPVGELTDLIERGKQFWREGNVPHALACVFAVREHAANDPGQRLERQRATLHFAVFARDLGKTRLARKLLDDLLCEPPDPSLVIGALILASSLWNHAGSKVVAWAMIAQAKALLDPTDALRGARVAHQEAKLLLDEDRVEEASRALDAAMRNYAAAGEPHDAMNARLLRIAVIERSAGPRAAIAWARKTVAEADRLGMGRQKASARIELGRLLAAAGRNAEAADELRRALAAGALLEDPRVVAEAREMLARVERDEP